ncbi:MAG: SDR family NAD(P)-dependent oxidoreductase [Acidimicrobiales bacterium]
MDLEGKTAVITGGASGIGLATARRFAAAGANLVLGDVEPGALERAVGELREHGASVLGVGTDVAREADVIALRDAALARFGAVHVVFNNAGVGGGATIGTPKAVWDWVLGVNLGGVINGINAFVPYFLERDEGHVVNTASLAGLGGVPGMGAYSASKFAVVGVSEALLYELALRDAHVGVSVLCPGFVRTRIADAARNMPRELIEVEDDPQARALEDLAREAVEAGIDPAVVADRVAHAVVANEFWILTHERVALRTTEQRLAWMRGGPPPGINLRAAARP